MSRKVLVGLLTLCILFSAVSLMAEEKVKGIIKSRTGDSLLVATDTGDVTVTLTDDTKTRDKRGLFGLEKQQLSNVVLIPGLRISVDGTTGDDGKIVAKTITTDGDDLEASQMVQAGLHPTAEQVAANVRKLEEHSGKIQANQENIATNKENIASNASNIQTNQANIAANLSSIQEHTNRFMALDDFDVKGQATVKFASGSSKLSKEDIQQLKDLAQTASQMPTYLVEVIGYADSTGNPAMNTVLSERRAKEVITFLIQQGGVPVRRVVAPAAMGEYGAAAPNETKAGRAENRRVEVKLLVNKGIAGQ